MPSKKHHPLNTPWAYLLFALVLLLLFHFLDDGTNWRRSLKFIRRANILNGLIYFGWFIFSGLVFISWLFAKSWWWRGCAMLIFAVTFFFEFSGHWIAGEGVSYHGILQIEQNRGFSLDTEVWDSFGWQFVFSGLFGLTLIGIIVFLQTKYLTKRINHWLIYFLPILTFIGGYGLIKKTQANRIDFPFPYKVIDVYTYAKLNGIYLGDRNPVRSSVEKSTSIDHVVLIVDESIRGDYLSINGHPDQLAQFLQESDSLILNYGVASSGGVCSNYSNIILLSGANSRELPDVNQKILQKPNIFQFAEQAKYPSHLLYSIGYPERPSGFWSKTDMNSVGKKWFVHDHYPNIPGYERDRKALNLLEEITDEKRSFTYFLKYGAHFHFENSYPESQKHFEPTQAVGDWNKRNREELLNSYKNSVEWNVNEFFKLIQNKFSDKNILFVYTSDHGQNLMDVEGMKLTHCAKGPAPKEMATVPLFLYSPNPNVIHALKENYFAENLNHASHFNIFPTLLQLFGYDKEWLDDNYDPSLFDNYEKKVRKYTSGDIFGRSDMYWNDFD